MVAAFTELVLAEVVCTKAAPAAPVRIVDEEFSSQIRALNLLDRLSYFSSQANPPKTLLNSKNDRVKWWIKTYFGRKPTFLLKHLRSLGISDAQIPYVLNSAAINDTPAVGPFLRRWHITENAHAIGNLHLTKVSAPIYGFESLCGQILGTAAEQFGSRLNRAQTNGIPLDSKRLLAEFNDYLRRRLAFFLMPSLILEANIERVKSSPNDSRTSEQRFADFADSLGGATNQSSFWRKFPALRRLISTTTQNTTAACIETIDRICDDRRELSKFFGLEQRVPLTSIEWGTGDVHDKGRVVAILAFEHERVVYKPRPLKASRAYNELLIWFSSAAGGVGPAGHQILDRGAYGYTSFIQQSPAQSKQEIATFYRKLGMLLAISWLLGLTDLHYENLIAAGGDPYLVDVEAMFDRPLRRNGRRPWYHDLSAQAFKNLLFGTGLLPVRMLGSFGVYDLSAIGARGDQPTPASVNIIKGFGRDDGVIASGPGVMRSAQNEPVYDEYIPKLPDHLEDLIGGFLAAVEIFEQNQHYLLAEDGILSAFTKSPVRWIARQTRDYVKLLQKLAHPTVAVDCLECDMLIAGELWSNTSTAPHLASIVRSEVEDLWNGDVPYFWTYPESRDLYSSIGIVVDFFETDGRNELKRRLVSLRENISPQIEAIRGAIKSTVSLNRDVFEHQGMPDTSPAVDVVGEDLIALAAQIGHLLIDRLHYVDGMPFSVGLTPLEEEQYTAGLAPPDFYDGIPGIGVFFAYLYKKTGEPRFRNAALDAHRLTRSLLEQAVALVPSCGAFSGLSGLIYSDLHLAAVLDQLPSIESKRSIRVIKDLVVRDTYSDIVSGAAGALLVMLRYFRQTGDLRAIDVAALAAERLAFNAESNKHGVTWHTIDMYEKRLGGLAHGVTGIAWALCEWAEYSGELKWAALAKQAFDYEQSLYDSGRQAWIDTRHGTPTCFWCYGAPGIGLAATQMRVVLGNAICDDVYKAACDATWRYGGSRSHSLCHGDLGNSELFLASNDTKRATVFVGRVLADHQATGEWRCGLPDEASTPGIMCGLAGIGYGLLRHASPEEIPNILLLGKPKC